MCSFLLLLNGKMFSSWTLEVVRTFGFAHTDFQI